MSPDFERSESDAIFDGLPFRTMISSEFAAKRVGVPLSNLASVTLFMVASSAAAKTSTGAPAMICCASVDDAAKLMVTFTSGCNFRKAALISVKAPCSEDAADTVRDPDSESVDPAVEEVVEDEPQAGANTSNIKNEMATRAFG